MDAEMPKRGENERKSKEKRMTEMTEKTDDRDNTPGPKRRGGARKRALRGQETGKSARKGGGSRAPAMGNSDGMVRDQFGSGKKMGKTEDRKDGIGETRGFASGIEIIITDPGTKNLARETK